MGIIQHIEFEGVEGIRVGRFSGRINTTCLVYRIGETLIDAGPPNQWKWIRQFIQDRNITRTLVTHHHEDHSGNGAFIREELRKRVLAPEPSLPLLQSGYRVHLYRRIIWGMPPPFTAEVLPKMMELGEGLTLKAIPAPGHSIDMHCFLIPERGWLFSGDLYISDHPLFSREDENPLKEIQSLQRILKKDFRIVFCAHRGVIENGKEALQGKLDYLLSLKEQVDMLRRAGKSDREIRKSLLGREALLSWLTGFHFSKTNLIRGLCG